MADVTGRMLALLATLRAGTDLPGTELSARLGVSPRTLRRDVERLRRAGYQVSTRPGPGGGYRLTGSRTMAPLALDDDEAVAVMLALATLGSVAPADADSLQVAATRAYGKADQLLPARLRPQVLAIRETLEGDRRSTPPVATRVLADLATHTSRAEIVTFAYTSADGGTSWRRCEPHRLVQLDQRWYLYAWDAARAGWRTFRADRITDLVGTGAHFRPRPLPEGGVARHLREGMGKERQRVVLTVEVPAARAAEVFRHHWAEIEPLTEHRSRVHLRIDAWHWLVPSLAILETGVRVEEPDELRAALHRFGERLSRA